MKEEIKTPEETAREQLTKILEFQKTCPHIGHLNSACQQMIPDQMSGKMILITTIVCSECGGTLTNQNTVEGIRVSPIASPIRRF